MLSVSKFVIIGAAAIIATINVAADNKVKEITLERTLQCMDHDTVISGLKNSGFLPIVSNISETNGKVDSVVQTWATPDGSWIVVEHNAEYKVSCILGVGEKTKIHLSTSKQSWV